MTPVNSQTEGLIKSVVWIIRLLVEKIVTYYWESLATRWLEIGIVIYDQNIWAKGIGYAALHKWIELCFNRFPEIQHIGLTTWSGNTRMMKLAEKLGLICEARIRKVRYYNGVYYDSIKYGILREEFSINRKS